MLTQLLLIKTNKTLHTVKSLSSFSKLFFFPLSFQEKDVNTTSLLGWLWSLTEIMQSKVELTACPVNVSYMLVTVIQLCASFSQIYFFKYCIILVVNEKLCEL